MFINGLRNNSVRENWDRFETSGSDGKLIFPPCAKNALIKNFDEVAANNY